jgi:MFS family permease
MADCPYRERRWISSQRPYSGVKEFLSEKLGSRAIVSREKRDDGGDKMQRLGARTYVEFACGWRVLLGATFGVGLGIAGLLTYNLGLFATELEREIGLSPAAYGGALLGLNLALAAAMPLVGGMVDRFGPRRIAAAGSVALAAGFLALSRTQSVAFYAGALIAIGFCASLSAPVAHTRAVTAAFDRRRGLALGVTQVGIGLAATLVPPLVAAQIGSGGWRSGFVLLAGLAAAGVVPTVLGLPGKRRDQDFGVAPIPQGSTSPWLSSLFRLQLIAFAAMAMAFIGIIAHFVPLLRASGVSLPRAGALAGYTGLSVIVTRLIVGWLADHVEPAWLGSASCVICAAGGVALAFGGVQLALPAALALGCAIGAEADLIGILTARNFPLEGYSRAYSAQYAAFTVAGGVSPLLVGVLVEVTGGYRIPVLAAAILLVIPAALFALLAMQDRPNEIILDTRNKNS